MVICKSITVISAMVKLESILGIKGRNHKVVFLSQTTSIIPTYIAQIWF